MMEDEKFDVESVKQAVKNLDDYLWNITNNVVCTICQEIFTDPVTTPCSHSFCSNCLKRLLSGGNSTKNSCPLCRKSIKRREAKHNHVLGNISKICFGLPDAFKEDVMNLNPDLKECANDLLSGTRLVGVYSDKDKEKTCKNVKKQKNTNKKLSKDKDKVSSPSVRLDGEETNTKNEECLDLKSVSQIELKSQLYVAESPEIEKKLRTVKRVPSQQKVNDWLEKVSRTSDPSSSFLTDNWETRDESIIQEMEKKAFGKSVMSLDFGNSEKPAEICEDKEKSVESDPYEFISSQRPYGNKPKRKSNRGRKKTIPGFQAIQSFTKDSVKKNYLNKTTDLFEDASDSNLQKTLKTYSRKSDKTVTIGEKTQEMLVKDYGGVLSDSEESRESESEIVPRSRRRILPLGPDIDSDSSVDKNVKKARIDSTVVISDCESNSKKSEDESGKAETLKTAKARSKSSLSSVWNRVSNSKSDFEMAEKSRRPRRKSLDISGGEPSLNSSKKSITEQSSENVSVHRNDVEMENLSGNSEYVTGFESPSSEEKKKRFKAMVEKMEEELEFEESYNAREFYQENPEFTEESVRVSPSKEIIRKTPTSKTIPFALLGKIRKKKRSSILFVKMGRLSPNFKRSRSTVVKLIFPKTIHRNGRKVGVAAETQTDLLSQYKLNKSLETVEHERFNLEEHKKINIEIQTVNSFLQSTSKEAQTSPKVVQKSVTVQTIRDDVNLEVPKECNPPPLMKANSSEDLYLDSELVSQFNKTWVTQGKRPSQNVNSFSLDKKEPNNTVIDLVSNDTNVLMQRVVNNINLDLARIKAVSRSPFKQPQQCEESDSDIFIEQTPPRQNSKSSSALLKTIEECPKLKSEPEDAAEESFLILSGCQSKTPAEYQKTAKIYKYGSQQVEEKSFTKPSKEESHEKDRNESYLKCGRKTSRDGNLSNRRICIVSSGVINRENIDKFVDKFKVEHLSCPRKDMTHLVVGLHENDDDGPVPYCTPKLLYAIANKKWVVTEEWVEACLKANAVVAEEPFESVDPAGGNGCSVARLSTDLLLKNCQVYLLGEYKSITKDEFSGLISDCGGTVVRHLDEFSFSPGHVRMILVDDSDVKDDAQIQDLMAKHSTLVMSRDVIFMSIQSYKIVNFTPFLIRPVSYEEMIEWGYPPDLVNFDFENYKDEAGSE